MGSLSNLLRLPKIKCQTVPEACSRFLFILIPKHLTAVMAFVRWQMAFHLFGGIRLQWPTAPFIHPFQNNNSNNQQQQQQNKTIRWRKRKKKTSPMPNAPHYLCPRRWIKRGLITSAIRITYTTANIRCSYLSSSFGMSHSFLKRLFISLSLHPDEATARAVVWSILSFNLLSHTQPRYR